MTPRDARTFEPPRIAPARRLMGLLLLGAGLVASGGCRPADETRTYRIAKAEPDDAANDTAPAKAARGPFADAPFAGGGVPTAPPTGEPTDRMLGAIVPGPDQAWFFKAVGPKATLDPAADTINAFFNSIRFEGAKPVWETPDGWSEEAGAGMRLATLKIPADEEGAEATELSVIGLGLLSDWDAQVLDNVNRWRKQMNLPPLSADELGEQTKPMGQGIEGGAEGAVLVDATGWFNGGTMAPFAGGGPMAAPAAVPPSAAPPSAVATPQLPPPPASAGLDYEKPAGWTEGKQSSMRKASFTTEGGAEVTAFVFNAAGAMGDPLSNVNRWRGEVGLPPTDAEQLAEQTESLPLLGGEGSYFELVGETETTYVAMVVRDGGVWFFKIRGPSEAVAAQREAFRAWLASLSLS